MVLGVFRGSSSFFSLVVAYLRSDQVSSAIHEGKYTCNPVKIAITLIKGILR